MAIDSLQVIISLETRKLFFGRSLLAQSLRSLEPSLCRFPFALVYVYILKKPKWFFVKVVVHHV
jgi:hypothetical protein